MTKRITLNEEIADIMQRLAIVTGLSVASIANRLLGSHLLELHELEEFLDLHPAGAGSLHDQALNLIQSHGPESIMSGIARIAPHYQTMGARFECGVAESIGKSPVKKQ